MRLAALALASCAALGCKGDKKDSEPAPKAPSAKIDAAPATTLEGLARGGVEHKWIRGAAVAIVRRGKPTEMAFVGDDGTGKVPTAATRFAIGSVTKVLTSVLLAEAAERGELGLDESLAKVTKLPMPSKAMTARHLSQHVSGLPRLPEDFEPKDMAQPYQDYDRAKLVTYLGKVKLRGEPGAADKEYSNLGAAVLGQILAERASTDYAALMRKRVIEPLGLKATTVGAPKDGRAIGHSGMLDAVEPWKLGVFEPAGAVWSSLDDMSRFVAANLEAAGPLAPALTLARKEKLGWQENKDGTLWHNGQTGGFHSFLAIDVDKGVGVIVLCNTATSVVDLFGFAVLDSARTGKTDFVWPTP